MKFLVSAKGRKTVSATNYREFHHHFFYFKQFTRQDMVPPQSTSKIIRLFLLCFFFPIIHLDLAYADPPYKLCPNTTNYAVTSRFQTNLNNLLLSFPSNATFSKFYNTSSGNDPDRVYGLFLCLDYITSEACKNCINSASYGIGKLCPKTTEAVVWEELCQLRYSSENFFGHLDVTGNFPQYNPKNISEPKRFRSVVNNTLGNLTKQAAFNLSTGMYATGEVAFTNSDTLYALVQCTKDLSPDDCNKCLETAITNISSCCYVYRGARLLSRSCYLRYELYSFYADTAESPSSSTQRQATEESGQKKSWMIIIITIVSACLLIAIVGSCVYCLAMRNRNNKEEIEMASQQAQLNPNNTNFQQQNFRGRNNMNPQESPFIDLETILAATNYFSGSNKLGQGGFGPVYKGILSDGKEVAVKRLSINSEQGSEEFINEVLLIMKLQHKNLVKLLGFCADGEEKMLVYEYMPNSSLDVVLFDPRKREQLDWGRRLNIISGLARGILYLHEDSRLRIIHRDLKPGNVLLDRDMNPKISDFGMARIFGGSEGQANTTTIVGTYGYMAPEYAMEGLYSIKSDVFSFGVLLLEIVSGRKNAGFHLSKHAPSLLVYAWQLWNEGKGLDLMDPLLIDSCSPDEFLRCIHIGLLCVQEEAFDRPTMSSVVVMLKTDTVSLRKPEQPAFSVGRFTDHKETGANDCSVNGLTISNILPR